MRMSEVVVSGVRKLSTISEKDVEAEPVSLVSSEDSEWTGSRVSLCPRGNKPSVESSTFTSFESFQSDNADDCVSILLACLYCRFYDIIAMLPDTCERVISLPCSPYYKYYDTSDEQPTGKDWCSCNVDFNCSFMDSCQETSELLELAMEISEVCYR